ncbi:MAG: hypothetical protein U5K69_18125 [Balneolaceae bacterium]|nr:hypothetical protein [Balneolaceae bacterium]
MGQCYSQTIQRRPKSRTALIYAADQDTRNAYWISTDHKTDSWTSSFLGSSPADSSFSSLGILNSDHNLHAKAPFMQIASPKIDSIQTQNFDSLRQYTFQVRPVYTTHATNISFPKPSQVRELIVDGKNYTEPYPTLCESIG